MQLGLFDNRYKAWMLSALLGVVFLHGAAQIVTTQLGSMAFGLFLVTQVLLLCLWLHLDSLDNWPIYFPDTMILFLLLFAPPFGVLVYLIHTRGMLWGMVTFSALAALYLIASTAGTYAGFYTRILI